MPTTHGPVTLKDACALAEIIRAAQGNVPLARLMSDGETVMSGTARAICRNDFLTAHENIDVRDLFLRVTLRSGTEVAWPVPELLADYHAARLALNCRP